MFAFVFFFVCLSDKMAKNAWKATMTRSDELYAIALDQCEFDLKKFCTSLQATPPPPPDLSGNAKDDNYAKDSQQEEPDEPPTRRPRRHLGTASLRNRHYLIKDTSHDTPPPTLPCLQTTHWIKQHITPECHKALQKWQSTIEIQYQQKWEYTTAWWELWVTVWVLLWCFGCVSACTCNLLLRLLLVWSVLSGSFAAVFFAFIVLWVMGMYHDAQQGRNEPDLDS